MANESIILDVSSVNNLLSMFPGDIGSSLSFIFTLLQVLGVITIVYLVFLIVRGVLKLRDSRNLSRMGDDISRIDKKMDKIIDLLGKKKSK